MNIVKSFVLSLGLGASSWAFAGGGATGGATEATQLLNNAELIEQVMTAKQQLDAMLADLQKLKNFVESGGPFTETLTQLNEIVQYGQALAYNAMNLSEMFNERYKDFSNFFQQETGESYDDMLERYQDWSREGLDNVHSALRAANLQSKYFQSDAQTIKEIEHQAQTAQGRDQLLQAGIAIAANQAKQMVELRQLISSDMQMQANYQAQQIQRQAEEDAAMAKALKKVDMKSKKEWKYL